MDELDLGGGATGARRVNDEVWRATGPWTPAVHALMCHARDAGVPETPAVIGTSTDASFERLAWIPGDDVGVVLGDDETLKAVGRLVRRVHDALASFSPPLEASWRLRDGGTNFVHGDIAPWNVVWRQHAIVGLLDWDQSGPGRDLEDLAYAAWVWVPLERPDLVPGHWQVDDVSLSAQRHRLRVLADAYGMSASQRRTLLSEIAYVQATGIGRIARGAATGDAGMSNIWWDGQRAGVFGAAMQWLSNNWDSFSAALQ